MKNNILSNAFLWMFIGLLISGGVAYYTSITPSMIKFVYGSYGWILITELIRNIVIPMMNIQIIVASNVKLPFSSNTFITFLPPIYL